MTSLRVTKADAKNCHQLLHSTPQVSYINSQEIISYCILSCIPIHRGYYLPRPVVITSRGNRMFAPGYLYSRGLNCVFYICIDKSRGHRKANSIYDTLRASVSGLSLSRNSVLYPYDTQENLTTYTTKTFFTASTMHKYLEKALKLAATITDCESLPSCAIKFARALLRLLRYGWIHMVAIAFCENR